MVHRARAAAPTFSGTFGSTSTKASFMTLPPAASLHQPARSFYSHWQQVNDWLVRHQELWQPAPFMEPEPAWCERYPELAHWLDTLTLDACEAFEENLAAFAVEAARFVPNLADYSALVELPELSSPDSGARSALPELQAVDMPGRKRLQAGAFAAAVLPLEQPVLDWCCGKGHLARTLAARGAAREIGRASCREGVSVAVVGDPLKIIG